MPRRAAACIEFDLCLRAIDKNATSIGPVHAGNDVDQRRLAGAVRADQGVDRSAGDAKTHLRKGHQAAERAR